MLTKSALESRDDSKQISGSRSAKDEISFEQSIREKIRYRALKIYRNELNRPSSIDLGLHGTTRAELRSLCKSVVLESSSAMRRRYSYSAISSTIQSIHDENNAISALRMLQKERLIVSRLGFPDKAMELDKEIEVMREKAKIARQQEENQILMQRMKTLAISHARKETRFEMLLAEETRKMVCKFKEEETKMLRRQEIEFLRVLEGASRRALGRVKKCNCATPYTCRHNKTASYNTRRPLHVVVQYRRNARRLKQAGRPEEGAAWEEKALEIDDREQERWRNRVADSIVSSPWGANEAAVDQITEAHKKELAVLRKTHQVKQDMHEKRQAMRRKNFQNTMLAEERKVKMQCRKQALLRIRRNYNQELAEEERQDKLLMQSDGLKNISRNLLGENFDDSERAQIDWVPPTSFGLDNSVRLLDAVNTIGDESTARVFTTFQDVKSLDASQIREKLYSQIKQTDSNDDSDETDEAVNDEDEGEGEGEDEAADEANPKKFSYKLGETSGSRLVDTMQNLRAKKEAANAAKQLKLSNNNATTPLASPAASVATTNIGGWSGATNMGGGGGGSVNTFNSFNGVSNGLSNGFGGGGGGFPFSNNGSMNSSAFPFQQNNSFQSSFMPNSFMNNFPSQPTNPSTSTNGFMPTPSFPTSAINNPPVSMPFTGGLSSNIPTNPPVNHPVAVPPESPAPSNRSFRTGQFISSPIPQFQSTAVPSSKPSDLPFPSMATMNSTPLNPFGGTPAEIKTPFPIHGDEGTPDSPQDNNNNLLDPEEAAIIRAESSDSKLDELKIVQSNARPSKIIINPYLFVPGEDDKPIKIFPGSLRDEDWTDHDNKLGNGFENSYGVELVSQVIQKPITSLKTKTTPSSSSTATGVHTATPLTFSSLAKNDESNLVLQSNSTAMNTSKAASEPIMNSFNSQTEVKFEPGHQPPPAGSVESRPIKSALHPTAPVAAGSKKKTGGGGGRIIDYGLTYVDPSVVGSVASTNHSEKKVTFGEDIVQIFHIKSASKDEEVAAPSGDAAVQIRPQQKEAFYVLNKDQVDDELDEEEPLVSLNPKVPSNEIVPMNALDPTLHMNMIPFQPHAPPSERPAFTRPNFNQQLSINQPPPPSSPQSHSPPESRSPPPSLIESQPNSQPSLSQQTSYSSNFSQFHDSFANSSHSNQTTTSSPFPFNNSNTMAFPFPMPSQPMEQQQQQQPFQLQGFINQISNTSSFPSFNATPNPFNNDQTGMNSNASMPNGMSSPSFPSFNSAPNPFNGQMRVYTNASITTPMHPVPPIIHPMPIDIHDERDFDGKSTASSDVSGDSRAGPNWDVCFERFQRLDAIHQTMLDILETDDLHDAAELYISTRVGSRDGVNENENEENHEEHDLYVQDMMTKLHLLRGWKLYERDPNDVELLQMGLEEVIGLEQEELENLDEVIQFHQEKLQSILHQMGYDFVPPFILSSDFGTYFESKTAVKAHNKKLRIDSKSWIGKFQKTVTDMNYPVHLFPFHGGRPYANKVMRAVFGPMCDAPTPREYLDNSSSPENIDVIVKAMKEGHDVMTAVVCRTLKSGKPSSIIRIKQLHSFKNPALIKYSLVMILDMTTPEAEEKLKIFNAFFEALPTSANIV